MSGAPLIVFALPQESRGHFDGLDVLYTGVGKVNAACALMDRLSSGLARPSHVINCGTAGSPFFNAGSLVSCTAFVQRDMDVTALGFEAYQTPFAAEPPVLTGPGIVPLAGYAQACCGTGDHFVSAWPSGAPFQIADMEAYALALICQRRGVPFAALKYISDGADGQAASDWEQALEQGAVAMAAAVRGIL